MEKLHLEKMERWRNSEQTAQKADAPACVMPVVILCLE